MQRCPQRVQIPAKVCLALSSQSACAMHCMWFLKSLNNKFSTKRGKSPHCTAFVCKLTANPLLLSGSLHWPQGHEEAFLIKCTALPFHGMPSKQKHSLPHPRTGASGSYLITLPACQQNLFGEAYLPLLSHSKSRSGIFFHLTMFLWS